MSRATGPAKACLTVVAGNPWSILWTGPGILAASLMIAWGAECSQFFVSQGLALAMLAWMQTLPEFAVEAVLGYHQCSQYLLANLTGALRLLTGLGWPMIYASAAIAYRAKHRIGMGKITLPEQQSIQVVGLGGCLVYVAVIACKASLTVMDAAVLIAIYAGYLWMLRHGHAEDHDEIDDLAAIPKAIVMARRPVRIAAIAMLFLGGGALIYFLAEPFLSSLFALAAVAGVSEFVFIQWVAPFVSEFPEFFSAFYWARSIDRAPMALMNLVSSNINQWTLLSAMLPLVLSLGHGSVTPLVFDGEQRLEYIMTLGQALLGLMFLVNMEFAWWEAAGLFGLWLVQFVFSVGNVGVEVHWWVTYVYFGWAALEAIRARKMGAWQAFRKMRRA
jgi:cation:H+ antiporter